MAKTPLKSQKGSGGIRSARPTSANAAASPPNNIRVASTSFIANGHHSRGRDPMKNAPITVTSPRSRGASPRGSRAAKLKKLRTQQLSQLHAASAGDLSRGSISSIGTSLRKPLARSRGRSISQCMHPQAREEVISAMAEVFDAATRVLTSAHKEHVDAKIEAKFSDILQLAREIQLHMETETPSSSWPGSPQGMLKRTQTSPLAYAPQLHSASFAQNRKTPNGHKYGSPNSKHASAPSSPVSKERARKNLSRRLESAVGDVDANEIRRAALLEGEEGHYTAAAAVNKEGEASPSSGRDSQRPSISASKESDEGNAGTQPGSNAGQTSNTPLTSPEEIKIAGATPTHGPPHTQPGAHAPNAELNPVPTYYSSTSDDVSENSRADSSVASSLTPMMQPRTPSHAKSDGTSISPQGDDYTFPENVTLDPAALRLPQPDRSNQDLWVQIIKCTDVFKNQRDVPGSDFYCIVRSRDEDGRMLEETKTVTVRNTREPRFDTLLKSWRQCPDIERIEIELYEAGRWRDAFMGACFVDRSEINGKKMRMKLLSKTFEYDKKSNLTGFLELRVDFE